MMQQAFILIATLFCLFYFDCTVSFSCNPFYRGRLNSLTLSAKTNANSRNSEDDAVTLIHSHHLLDHKPDNMILSGKKFKLRGIACLGRPGVALCLGSRNNVKKFLGKLKKEMPQKKIASIEIEVDGDGNESSLPSTAVDVLDEAIGNGFSEATLADLREFLTMLGREDQFFNLVGVSPSESKSKTRDSDSVIQRSIDEEGSGGRRKKKKKKRSMNG